MEFLNHLVSVIPDGSAPWIASVAVAIEFALRLIHSTKPLSILHLVGGGARVVGSLFVKVADLLDKILPQKLK